MHTRSARARIEQLVDDGLVSLALATLAFANAKDVGADFAEIENFNNAASAVSDALRGIRHVLSEE